MLHREACPYSYFHWCEYSWGPWMSFVTTGEFSVRVIKITSRIGVSVTHSLLLCFILFLTPWIMVIFLKWCKPENFESHNSLKLNFTNIWGLHSNFVKHEFFLEWNFSDVLALWETNLNGSIDSGNFSVRGYLPLIEKILLLIFYYSHSWSCSLCKRTSFCMWWIYRKLWGFLIKFLINFTSLSVSLLFLLSIIFIIVINNFWFWHRWGSLNQPIC